MALKFIHNISRCIYNTDGNYVGFVQNGYFFDVYGNWLGFIRNENHVYSKLGEFIGYLIDDDRIVRNKTELPKLPVLPPLPPLPPMLPLQPPMRLPLSVLPSGYEDVFKSIDRNSFNINRGQDFSKYEGMDILAEDGTFLGKISKNTYDDKSISNPYTFGSSYNKNSIFNPYGKYGGEYSNQSPFNQYANKPPKIKNNERFIAVLSVNPYLSTPQRVNPTKLLLWLGKFIPA